MAPRLHYILTPVLFHILAGLFAVLVLVSVASARRRTSYNIHVHDDEGGYIGHIKEKSRAEYGKDPMNLHHDDDGVEKQGYGTHKGVLYEYYRKGDDGHSKKGYSIGKPKKLSEVVPVSISVQGVVLCQDCKYVGSDSLTDATPVAGAQVKLVCQTRSSSLSAAITTDSNGFFLISVPDFNFEEFTPGEDCMAFLVSSPLKECSTVTDISSGKTGSPLIPIPTFAPSSNLMYFVGPFACAPELCSSKP